MNPTTDDAIIKDLPIEIGTTTYVELITIVPRHHADNDAGSCGVCTLPDTFRIERDLFDPASISIVRDMMYKKALSPSSFSYNIRDFNSNTISPIDVMFGVLTRMSIVAVRNDVTATILAMAMKHLMRHRELIPSRVAY